MADLRAVNQYTLERKLGQGGMAEVWQASHSYLGTKCAIKFLLPRFAGDPELEVRFLSEGKRQAGLHHTNIVAAIDFLQVEGRSYLVMQYVEGQSLETRLAEHQGPLPLEEVHAIAWDVLSALDYAHSQEVVHRDVKPSNLLLDESGRVLISDFGIALAMSEETRVTRTGLAIGTPEYMSPEQILRPRAVDYRSDIYGFGCVLFAMLSGGPPFSADEGSTEFHIKDCHVRATPPSLVDVNREVTPEIEAVAMRCLEKDPAQRYQSCRDVMEALDAALRGETVPELQSLAEISPEAEQRSVVGLSPVQVEHAPAVVTPIPSSPALVEVGARPERRKRRRSPWLWIAAALVIVLVAGAFAYNVVFSGTETVLAMEGSTTVGLELAPALVQEYLKAQGGTDIRPTSARGKGQLEISAKLPGSIKRQSYRIVANGSGHAFTALENGTAQIGMASRAINDSEHTALSKIGDFRSFASENVIGLDGIAIIVNRANPVESLSRAQLRSIFGGEATDWSAFGKGNGPIHLFSRDKESGTFGSFKDMVMGKGDLASSAVVRSNGEDITAAVVSDVDAIGFVALPQVGRARALAISDGPETLALIPNSLTVATEDYPLSRRLFLYTAPSASPEVERFIRFTLSPRGQEEVQRIGFVPVTATLELVAPPPNAPPGYHEITSGKRRMRLDFRFRSNSFDLDNKALADVERATSILGNGSTVYLLGFADSQGGYQPNFSLSQQRAEVVGKRFKERGVNVVTRGFSYEMPVADNHTEEGRQKNRRVEVWVS